MYLQQVFCLDYRALRQERNCSVRYIHHTNPNIHKIENNGTYIQTKGNISNTFRKVCKRKKYGNTYGIENIVYANLVENASHILVVYSDIIVRTL